jgi:hypothetical protein
MPDPELTEICRSALLSYSGSFRGRDISAEFYPYIGMTHTIRRRGSAWLIRISDHCRAASREVLEAIVILLACKIERRKIPSHVAEIYARFRHSPEVAANVAVRRRARGRKQIDSASGRWHSLVQIYRDLNNGYFNNQVEIRKLGWGARRSWRRLGHYDPVHHTITISPVLDSPRVPASVMAYLLYHEMLHTLFPGDCTSRRERHHPREFKAAERAFPGFESSRGFLDHFCRTRGRI